MPVTHQLNQHIAISCEARPVRWLIDLLQTSLPTPVVALRQNHTVLEYKKLAPQLASLGGALRLAFYWFCRVYFGQQHYLGWFLRGDARDCSMADCRTYGVQPNRLAVSHASTARQTDVQDNEHQPTLCGRILVRFDSLATPSIYQGLSDLLLTRTDRVCYAWGASKAFLSVSCLRLFVAARGLSVV
jgi:hypothetical protein